MIEAKEITKMVKHIVRRNAGKFDANIMHPMREWAFGLLVIGLLVLGGIIFTIGLYRIYRDSLETVVPVVSATIPYKASLVADAIVWYEKERMTYEAMRGALSVTSVPTRMVATTTTPREAMASSTVPVMIVATSSTSVIPVKLKMAKEPIIPEKAVPQM